MGFLQFKVHFLFIQAFSILRTPFSYFRISSCLVFLFFKVSSLLVIFEDLWKIGETVAALSCPDVHKEDGHGSPYPCVHFYIPLPPAENLGQMVHSDDF